MSFDQINSERGQVEEQLARVVSGGDAKQQATISKRLDKIQKERLRLLARLEESPGEKVSVFISYAHEDRRLRAGMEKQLSILKRQRLLAIWHDREITAGSEWSGEISAHLDKADLILLLISPDFVASDYCYDVEMKRAVERHDAGEARVIPVILRSVMWSNTPFSKLQALPTDGKPINTWGDRDAAFLDVAEGIRTAINAMRARASTKQVRRT